MVKFIHKTIWRLHFMFVFKHETTLSWKSAWVTSKEILKCLNFDTDTCPVKAANVEAKSFRNFIRKLRA